MKKDKKECDHESCVNPCANPTVGRNLAGHRHVVKYSTFLAAFFCPPAYLSITFQIPVIQVLFFQSVFLFFSSLRRRDAQVSLPGGRCQFTSSIFCYSSPLGINQTWTAAFWWVFVLHFGLLPSVKDGGWGLALPALKSTTWPSWDLSSARIASEVGTDVILHGDTSASHSPSQHFREKSFGRGVVGSPISFHY